MTKLGTGPLKIRDLNNLRTDSRNSFCDARHVPRGELWCSFAFGGNLLPAWNRKYHVFAQKKMCVYIRGLQAPERVVKMVLLKNEDIVALMVSGPDSMFNARFEFPTKIHQTARKPFLYYADFGFYPKMPIRFCSTMHRNTVG